MEKLLETLACLEITEDEYVREQGLIQSTKTFYAHTKRKARENNFGTDINHLLSDEFTSFRSKRST